MFGLLLLTGSWGCSDAQINEVVVKLFEPKRTPQQHMVVAFASEDPDVRREALAEVAASDEYSADWAIKGYIAVALLDDDPQARCVAIRALARTGDPRATETLLKLLNYREYPPREVRPPDGLCRWDACLGLAKLSAGGGVPEAQRDRVRETLIERLRQDTEWQARAAAASGLGYYPAEETVEALIAGLNDEVFTVVHACEESLVRLTGYTHHCNAVAWEDWLAEHREDMFARAGQVPESRRLPYRNGWEKVGYDLKRFVRWLVPPRKE